MKDLGMWSSLDGLLELQGQGEARMKDRTKELKELWHEGKWRTMNWDESLLSTQVRGGGVEVFVPGREGGYNELLHCCLDAVKENDNEMFSSSLIQAKEVRYERLAASIPPFLTHVTAHRARDRGDRERRGHAKDVPYERRQAVVHARDRRPRECVLWK